jgi:hypothetical protein
VQVTTQFAFFVNLGVPLIAIALPRLYDRQAKRAAKVYQVQNTHSAISTVRMLLEQLKSNQVRPAPSYLNGAIQAFDIIEQMVGSREWGVGSKEHLIDK